MTANTITRRTAGAVTAALVLGTAGPAAAQPIGATGPVHLAPPVTYSSPSQPAHTQAFAETTAPLGLGDASVPGAQPTAGHSGSGSGDLIYVLIGGVGVLVGGLGGVLAASSRRRPAPTGARVAV